MTVTSPSPETGDDAPPATTESGWCASLRIGLAGRRGRTRIIDRDHRGPLIVQKPFYPEADGCCHLYVVHPPGGVVGGDHIDISVDVSDEGHALVTTPAATKLYRSASATATIDQRLRVEAGSSLEWLPQETIAFDGSRTHMDTTVDVEAGGSFIGWDVLCLGRPAASETFDRGQLIQRLRLRRDGVPLVSERLALGGSGAELEAAWGLRGSSTIATLVAVHPDGDASGLIASVREVLPLDIGLAAVTMLSGILVCRVLSDSARQTYLILRTVWQAIRPQLLGRGAVHPRIWAT